jgi:hypothetical protein
VGLLLFYRVSGNVDCLIGSDPPNPLKKQGVFKVGGKLQNDFFKTLFYTAIAPFFRNFGLINIKNQPKH